MSLLTLRHLETDFLIAGGGLAGVCAALAAVRNGAKVVLIQDRSVLGGNASSEIRMHAVGADCHGKKPGARESGIIEEILLEDAMRNPHRSYAQWDLLLYEKVKLEPNITLLLDTDVVGAEVETRGDGRRMIRRVRAVREATEDEFIITAVYFADCTGDGRLGAEAGADFHVGREAKETYDETLAREHADRQTLGSSILLTARKHEQPQPYLAPTWTRRFAPADFKLRPILSYEYGYWWFEWGGQLDTLKDNERIRHELLRIALGVWDYIKNSGQHPDSANWSLDWVGALPGKRESRRFLGPHVLTEHDVLGGRIFPDQVAYGGWPIDLHPPSGVDVPDEPPYTPTHFPHVYSIPLRSYYSRNVANLFFAGRNISASHVGFASTRVMKTCAVGGQAIGTAAALWLRTRSREPDIAAQASAMALVELQQTLLRDDAFLPALRNEDPRDLARAATVTADSNSPAGRAPCVVDGVARDLKASFGAWSTDSLHAWASASLPATLTLRLAAPAQISEIHVTFDTGFARQLCLSASDSTTRMLIRGPQPETVRHYRVRIDGKIVAEEQENFLRKRVHRLTPSIPGQIVAIECLTTHGLAQARIFEVRVYA